MLGTVEMRRNCVTCPLKCDMFKKLSDDELEKINNTRTDAKFNAGELIFKQGAPNNHIIFITKGLVKVFMEGYEGKDVILSLVKPTQFISGPELYYNSLAIYSASALVETECCYVNENLFKQFIIQNRSFSEAFISEFARRSTNTLNSLVSLTQKKMNGRIAEGLLYLSRVFESDTFDMILTKKEFGDLTAMTRESAIRILQQFIKEGLITSARSKISIIDKEKLRVISEVG